MIARLGRPRVTLPRPVYLRAVQTTLGGNKRLRLARVTHTQVRKPTTLKVAFPPITTGLVAVKDRRLMRRRTFRQPYENHSLMDTVASQAPLFIHVELP